jgi:hypothetical protein
VLDSVDRAFGGHRDGLAASWTTSLQHPWVLGARFAKEILGLGDDLAD